MTVRKEEAFYTVGQLADMLGCSVRSIYRWEERGVIPQALRVDRGEVSARVYTQSQVEEIRQKVQARISFTTVLRERPQKRRNRDSNLPLRVVKVKKKNVRPSQRGVIDEITMDPSWAPVFIRAMTAARKYGCKALTLVTATGDVHSFTQ
jgi:hypothetical protein